MERMEVNLQKIKTKREVAFTASTCSGCEKPSRLLDYVKETYFPAFTECLEGWTAICHRGDCLIGCNLDKKTVIIQKELLETEGDFTEDDFREAEAAMVSEVAWIIGGGDCEACETGDRWTILMMDAAWTAFEQEDGATAWRILSEIRTKLIQRIQAGHSDALCEQCNQNRKTA